MVTKQAQVDGTWYHIRNGERVRPVYKYKGLEAEATKEYGIQNGVLNGEWFFAIDSDASFEWDEGKMDWIRKS